MRGRCVTIAALLFAASSAGAMAGGRVPSFESSGRCPLDGTEWIVEACTFLRSVHAANLQAPPGGRAYRESWQGPFAGKMHKGRIELTITADGKRFLKTPWHRGAYRLKAHELDDFESRIARSEFATLPVYNRESEVCVDGVATTLEAVVGGKYRLAYFDYCGGVFYDRIADALDKLFVLAAGKSGLRYPVNPDHPTYRGY